METEDNPEIAEFLDDLKELGIGDLESPRDEAWTKASHHSTHP